MEKRKGEEEDSWVEEEKAPLSLPTLTSCCQTVILPSLQAAGKGILASTGKSQQSLSASAGGVG